MKIINLSEKLVLLLLALLVGCISVVDPYPEPDYSTLKSSVSLYLIKTPNGEDACRADVKVINTGSNDYPFKGLVRVIAQDAATNELGRALSINTRAQIPTGKFALLQTRPFNAYGDLARKICAAAETKVSFNYYRLD